MMLNHRLPSDGAVARKGNRRCGNRVDRRAKSEMERELREGQSQLSLIYALPFIRA
jgi:hypothetical protein